MRRKVSEKKDLGRMGDGVLRKSRRDTADARNGTCDTVVTGWKIIRKKGRIECLCDSYLIESRIDSKRETIR